MKKLLILVALLVSSAQAQEMTHRYFNYDQHCYKAGGACLLGTDSTTDGFGAVYLTDGTVKGATKFVSNEFRVGTVSNHSWALIYNDLVAWSLLNNGNWVQNATSGGNIVINKDKTGVIDSTEPTAALGTTIADAVLIAANVTFVTGADAATGVKFPVAPIAGQRFVIYNTANAVLKVYPGEATDNINANADGANIELAAYASLYCHASSADVVWCGELANP